MWRDGGGPQHAQYDGAATEIVTYPVYGTSEQCTMCNGCGLHEQGTHHHLILAPCILWCCFTLFLDGCIEGLQPHRSPNPQEYILEVVCSVYLLCPLCPDVVPSKLCSVPEPVSLLTTIKKMALMMSRTLHRSYEQISD